MKTKIIIGVLVVILIVLGISFGFKKSEVGTLKIGALYALSGPSAIFGEVSAQGVRDAVKYFEEKTGEKVELILEDSANDPKIAVSAATKMLEIDNVKFMVTGMSGVTNAVAPLAEKAKAILITDAAGYGLTKDKSYLFQGLLPSLNDVPKQLNDKAEWQKVALLLINDEFSNLWETKWRKDISSNKEIKTFKFEKSMTDFKTDALKMKTFNPDVIVVIGYGPAVSQALSDLSLQGVKTDQLTYLACTIPGIVSDKRYDLNGTYSYEYPDYQNSEIKNWISKNGGSNSTFYGLAFENTLTALYAMKATSNDPEKALTYLKSTKNSGVYGDIRFNQNNVIERDLVLTKIESGKCVR
jgi:ABC-type branched-subunit amino acid transport system substrate-binding protein